jgi:hypothetical protein
VQILALSAFVMLVGCFAVAGSVRTAYTPDHVRLALTAIGFTCIVGAGLRAILGLRRILEDDAYIALRTDTLVFHDAGRDTTFAWDAIEDVAAAPDGVTLVLRDAPATTLRRSFAGVTSTELAKRIAHVRRRVLFGLER